VRRTLSIAVAVAVGIILAGVGTVALATRNISGVYSLPDGNPVVTGTKITTTWANGTLGDIGTELTNSLSRDGYGGMRAPLQCTDGNAGAPSITFGTETTTGFYRIGSNDVGLSIGGTKRWEQTASGMTETGWATFSGTVTTPAVTSSGVRLQLIAPATFDTEISASTTVGFVVKADGTNDNKSRRLVNVADPTSAQDAVTKAYADSIVAVATTTITAGSNWTLNFSRASKRAGIVTVNISLGTGGAAPSWGSVAVVPAGWRPGDFVYFIGSCFDSSAATTYVCRGNVATDGTVSFDNYDDGTKLTSIFAAATSDTFRMAVTYVAEN
jgi:hypothetical protein